MPLTFVRTVQLPPRRSRIASVAVACNFGAACVVDCDDIAENVLLVQIIIKLFICVGRVAVHHAHRETIIVVEVHEQLIAPFLRDNPVAAPAGYPAGDKTSLIELYNFPVNCQGICIVQSFYICTVFCTPVLCFDMLKLRIALIQYFKRTYSD